MDLLFPSDRVKGSKRTVSVFRTAFMLALVTGVALGCNSKAKPKLASSSLSPEQLQVYGDFLDTFSALHFRRLANQTAPLNPSEVPEGSPCVRGLDLENQSDARSVLHRFGVEITTGRDLILVDPIEQAMTLEQKESEAKNRADKSNADTVKTAENISSEDGFVALSEIVFDKSHQFAVLKYLYFCGSHCKHGGTLVMEKVGTSWTAKTRRPCTMIIN